MIAEYFDTGSAVALRDAADFMLDWAHYHLRDGKEADFSWYDMAVGIRALRLAFILDRVDSGALELSETELTVFDAMAKQHAIRLQNESFINLDNHGLFQIFGLNLLCSIQREKDYCAGGAAFAARMFEKILDRQYTIEGVHKEHSPTYHLFVTRTIDRLGGVEKFRSAKAEELVERARRVSPWLAFPDGQIVRIGDSDGSANHGRLSGSKRCLDARCFAVGDFSGSGYAVVRSETDAPIDMASMLFVTGMAYSDRHKHADDLSFELFEFGRAILIDSGKYGYEVDAMRSYVRSAAAHNTISLHENAINPRQIEIKGSSLGPVEIRNEEFLISGEIERPDLFRQKRAILYDPGRALTIKDRVTAEREWTFVSSLHLAPDLLPQIDGLGFSVKLDRGRTLRAELLEQDCKIESARGQKEPLLGWATKGYLVMEPTTVVRAICRGFDRTITWTIRFDRQ
jgi:hypothetical protein